MGTLLNQGDAVRYLYKLEGYNVTITGYGVIIKVRTEYYEIDTDRGTRAIPHKFVTKRKVKKKKRYK